MHLSLAALEEEPRINVRNHPVWNAHLAVHSLGDEVTVSVFRILVATITETLTEPSVFTKLRTKVVNEENVGKPVEIFCGVILQSNLLEDILGLRQILDGPEDKLVLLWVIKQYD